LVNSLYLQKVEDGFLFNHHDISSYLVESSEYRSFDWPVETFDLSKFSYSELSNLYESNFTNFFIVTISNIEDVFHTINRFHGGVLDCDIDIQLNKTKKNKKMKYWSYSFARFLNRFRSVENLRKSDKLKAYGILVGRKSNSILRRSIRRTVIRLIKRIEYFFGAPDAVDSHKLKLDPRIKKSQQFYDEILNRAVVSKRQ